jgi:hypothetical protein
MLINVQNLPIDSYTEYMSLLVYRLTAAAESGWYQLVKQMFPEEEKGKLFTKILHTIR